MTGERKKNRAPLAALLLALASIGVSAIFFFVSFRGEIVLQWVSLLLAAAGLIWGVIGVWRAYGQPQIYSGKVSAPIFAVIALLVLGLMGFGWKSARQLPASTGAPQLGQKAPDFTLSDSNGKQVSLAQLLQPAQSGNAAQPSTGSAPKAVLLIFYRGYW